MSESTDEQAVVAARGKKVGGRVFDYSASAWLSIAQVEAQPLVIILNNLKFYCTYLSPFLHF